MSYLVRDEDGGEYEAAAIVCPQCGEVCDHDADLDQAETGDLIADEPCDLCAEADERAKARANEGDHP
jgi:hypothetical protein